MKDLKALGKYYHEFTPIERLNLYLKAYVRKDYAESDKLVDTCAKYKYILRDLDFTHKYDRLISIALLFMIQFQDVKNRLDSSECLTALFYEKIRVYDWIIGLLEQDLSKQEITAKIRHKLTQVEQKLPCATSLAEQKLVALKTEIEAYKGFCSEVGLDVDTAFKWLDNTVALDAPIIESLNNIAPDDTKLTERKQQYRDAWI
jgi:hypothetical protein